jgi:hypothetical protein
MKLLGEWNWCLPRWLEWLPHLTREPVRPGQDIREEPKPIHGALPMDRHETRRTVGSGRH